MTYFKSGQMRNAVQSAACQHSFWNKLSENAKNKYQNSPRPPMRNKIKVECSAGDRSFTPFPVEDYLLLPASSLFFLRVLSVFAVQ